MENKTSNVISGSAAVLAILAIVVNFGLVGQDNVYVCQDPAIAMKCDKLSAVNEDGTQTRCYYKDEELDRNRYKVCSAGWLPYIPEKEANVNFSNLSHIYLFCEKDNELISLCQVVDQNSSVYKVGGGK